MEPTTPTSITQTTRALMAEIQALKVENRMLQDPALPDYIALVGAHRERIGLTDEQTIDLALLQMECDETVDAPMAPDMREAFIEYAEGRAIARVTSAPNASSNVIAFRTRKTLS